MFNMGKISIFIFSTTFDLYDRKGQIKIAEVAVKILNS